MKRLLLGAALLLTACALALVLDPTCVLLGALRQERFYGGRPTSYWRKELLDTAPGAQTNAIKALADGGRQAVPVLLELLRRDRAPDGSAEVRRVAATALGHIGPQAPEAVPALIELLDDADAEVRITAADSLGKVGPAAGDAVPKMAALLKTDEPVRVLKALRRLRGANRAALPALIDALEHVDAEARENAAEALGEIGPAAADAVPALRKALDDENEKVREEAGKALEKIVPPGGRR